MINGIYMSKMKDKSLDKHLIPKLLFLSVVLNNMCYMLMANQIIFDLMSMVLKNMKIKDYLAKSLNKKM